MKRLIMLTTIVVLMTVGMMYANEFTISTPEGSFSIKISDPSMIQGSTTNAGTLIENIGQKLEELDKTYLSKLSRLDKTKADKLLTEIFAMLALIPADASVNMGSNVSVGTGIKINITDTGMMTQSVESIQPVTPVQITEAPKAVVQEVRNPMSNSDFQRFLNNVKGESFSEDQVEVIKVASRNNWFKVDQIIQVIGVLSFSEDKIEALEIMYPRVTDPQNAHNIPNAFTFSDDKSKASRIISR